MKCENIEKVDGKTPDKDGQKTHLARCKQMPIPNKQFGYGVAFYSLHPIYPFIAKAGCGTKVTVFLSW